MTSGLSSALSKRQRIRAIAATIRLRQQSIDAAADVQIGIGRVAASGLATEQMGGGTVRDLGFCGLLVNGPTDGRFLDDPRFEPILARAEALGVPIYIHPGIPSEKVRAEQFDGLPGNFSFALAVSTWAGTWRPQSTSFGWF